MPEMTTRLAALRSGQVDWIEVPPPDAVQSLKGAGFEVLTGVYPHVWPWVFNLAKADSPFRDVKVRQAANYCVDRDGLLKVAAMRDDALDARGPARLGDHDLVSFRNRARGDGTGKAAEIEVRAVHILDGKAERQLDGGFVDRHGFQMLDQRRAGIPGRALGTAGDIVAIARRHRDRHDAGEA